MRNALIGLWVGAVAHVSLATTWNEPWQETVVKNAESFVRGKVLESDPAKGCRVARVKQLAGVEVPETFDVVGFSLLKISSYSAGHPPQFRFKAGTEYYFFLTASKKKKGYDVPTPTSGFAFVSPRGIHGTYTHSYYQALVEEGLYEKTMTAIFNRLHGEEFDTKGVEEVIEKYLKKEPTALRRGDPPEKTDLFFKQHVALETFYYFGVKEQYALLEPFLALKDKFVQISAARALSRIDTPEARERLFKFLTGDNIGFARIMALWGLKRLGAKEYLPKLKEFLKVAPDKETGFGGNIMDPRVGTYFPGSVKAAVAAQIAEWEPKKEKEK
ncbi:MAG: HEAT repeat domain-containing protein [Planctomycetota bacterium]|jgi:hypothetical protein